MTKKTKKVPVSDQIDRREQILEVACKCIIKFGLHKTNAQVIANEMGISQTTIFYYFPKQQMLFEALFDHIIAIARNLSAKVFSTVRHTPTHLEKLLMYIKGQLMWEGGLSASCWGDDVLGARDGA